jgi:hypothetical protein
VIKMDYYVHSKRAYAVNLGSFVVGHEPRRPYSHQGAEYWTAEYWTCRIGAVWFRGKTDAPEVCIGEIRWNTRVNPMRAPFNGAAVGDRNGAALRAVEAHQDGSHGGSCWAKLRTDGTLWTSDRVSAAQAVEYENRLIPILGSFPDVPKGWNGWWRFPARAELSTS